MPKGVIALFPQLKQGSRFNKLSAYARREASASNEVKHQEITTQNNILKYDSTKKLSTPAEDNILKKTTTAALFRQQRE